jgi:uncharacterized membrane protein
MIKIEQSIVISRPVEEVFAFHTDLSNATQWEVGVLEVKQLTEGPPGVGTTWKGVRQALGRRIEQIVEATEWEPNNKASYKSASKPFPMQTSFSFESVDGATKLTSTSNIQLSGFFKLLKPIINRMVNRQVEASFQDLKEFLETRA